MYLILFVNVMLHSCFTASRVVVALFAIELGANPLMIGVMVAFYSVPTLLLGLYAGRVSDRYGVRPPMLFASALISVGLALPYLRPQVTTLYFSAAVIGAAFVFYNAAVQNFTGGYGPREERAANFSTLSLGYSISGFVGPLAAGYAIDSLNHANTYLCLAISALLPLAVLVFRGKFADIGTRKAPAGNHSALELLRMPELRKALMAGAMVVTGWDLYMFYVPLYGRSVGMSASAIGVVLGIFAAATFVVRFSVPYLSKRFSSRRVLAVAMFFGATTFVLFPFVKVAWLLGALSFAIGLALGCGQPLTLLMSYNRSPEGRTGEVTGIRLVFNHLMHSTVPVVAGGFGAAFGVAPVFFAIAAILAGSGYLVSTIAGNRAVEAPKTQLPHG